MTRQEHCLTGAAEECYEVGQRVTKILRFGPHEVQPGQSLDNEIRAVRELHDLIAMLELAGVVTLVKGGQFDTLILSAEWITAKQQQFERYLAVSREQGTLTESAAGAQESEA